MPRSRCVPVEDPLIQGSLGSRSGRDLPLGLLHKMQELGFRSRENAIAQGDLRSPRSRIPALKDGAFPHYQ